MKAKKQISIFLNSIFILILLLFVFDTLTAFEIKNQAIKSFVYIGIMIVTPIVLIWNIWFLKTIRLKIVSSVLPTLVLIVILIIGPMKIIFSSASWKTEKVLYENGHLPFKKVELQTQDVGALGYNKRMVEVIYLTPWFMIINPIKKDIDKRIEWIKIIE